MDEIRDVGTAGSGLRWRVIFLTWSLLICAPVSRAHDVIPSVVLPCPGCTTWQQMQTTAADYFRKSYWQTPPGFPQGKYIQPCVYSWWAPIGEPVETVRNNCTVAVLISTTHALSGSFEFSRMDDGRVTASPVHSSSNEQLREFDNYLNARAAGLPPIDLPDNLRPNDIDEHVIEELRELLVMNGPIVADFWQGLKTWNFSFVRVSFTYTGTPPGLYWVFVGDAITVRYSNGWTEKYRLIDPRGSIAWEKVDGSLRDENGRKPGMPHPNTSASNAQGVEYGAQGGGGLLSFYAVPVTYNVPGSRIDREGIVIIHQVVPRLGGDTLMLFME